MFNGIHSQRGMSLLELMIVIAIISILATIASLSMSLIREERVRSASKELFTDLQQARVNAMTSGSTATILQMRGMGVRFVSSASYVFFKFNDCDEDYAYDVDTCPPGSTSEAAEERPVTLPASIEMKLLSGGSVVSPDNTIRIFDRLGMPRTDTWNVVSGFTIILQDTSGKGVKCIEINTNSIREGMWNAGTNTCTIQ